ncbi:MAG: TetR/AcrR family transcriptional regulator [Phycisphaeraceae bacterium]|nr:TetR/AcrR family transcriptional regulator [Phycisphaeraceae bacterium]
MPRPRSKSPPPAGRINQRRRTRKDLLAAAARLLKRGGGRAPDMDAVADEAMVSRATAYRYFPSIESMLVEAPLDGAAPDPESVFADDHSTDPVARIDKAEARLHDMCVRNEAQLRIMLAASLEQVARASPGDTGVPVRQNRRTPLIEAALAPARHRFTQPAYHRLRASLALLFGVESMIVFGDVLGMDAKSARKVKSWAAAALVRAALSESQSRT